MAYEYTPRQIENWDPWAQVAIYREKFIHQEEQTAYWRGRALTAQNMEAGQ